MQELPISNADQQKNIEYLVNIPLFEGPLDLLLQLIEKAELDITKLSLSAITDQYLSYLNQIINISSQNVSEFIVIASKLIQIKSEALLPSPPIREVGEEDPGEALAQQLKEYKQFKEISKYLQSRQQKNLRNYFRLASTPKIEKDLDMIGLNLSDLIDAAKSVFSRKIEESESTKYLRKPRITIREKIIFIRDFLFQNHKGSLFRILPTQTTRIDIVVTFLAILELVKLRLVFTKQEQLFEDIEFEKSPDWQNNLEIDLEFGE
jgi:segregation and condensation protein A